ncbi:outer membrane protein assembly factor BamD [Pseudothermotoga thermarum]|uniref:Lipoprotein n=1 Tax=Pseudothermotoga thermarum DSM 5069 TaxID=688269 RepID=F7YV30_9THEM|nr:hypothetical protein [Pseudothermotoga thermarum]AEH50320.1 hypothetical protein Theth_0219 [Pseudothermotoga thermarum DSM 5069]
MKRKLTWLVLPLLAVFILSSCAVNLFVDFELNRLLQSGTPEERLNTAQQALSGKNYDAAITLAGSVLNELLDLDLTPEELENLLEEETLQKLIDGLEGEELNEDALAALAVLVEAVAAKSGKSIVEVAEDLEDLLTELGIEIPGLKNGENEEDLWEIIKENLPTIAQKFAKMFDNRVILKFLTVGYLTLAENGDEPTKKFYAALAAWYDIGFMLNLILDTNDDGNISDEDFIKNVTAENLDQLLQETISGLYEDEEDCEEFVWASEKLEEILGMVDAEIDLPSISEDGLKDKENLKDLFEYLLEGDQT